MKRGNSGVGKTCNLSLYGDNIFLVSILEIENKELNMKEYVNDFNYDEEEKRIVILIQKDNFICGWENVEKDDAAKARELFYEKVSSGSRDFESFLLSNGSKRFWC
jgi:hypothetical protein